MERELREAEERIALSALDALSTQIAILAEDGTVLATNKAWRDFGAKCPCDRAGAGRNYFSHVRGKAQEPFARFCAAVKTLAEGGQPVSMEYACQVDGTVRWFHGRAARFGDNDSKRLLVKHEDISERVALEREIVAVSGREQQRFGQELHDGLSQHLTGLKFKASLLEYQLRSRELPEAAEAQALSQLLNDATDEASKLARRVSPVESEPRGLMMALRELARASSTVTIKCHYSVPRPVFIHDHAVATHAYRIAEEAIVNALEHGAATEIHVSLKESKDGVCLLVRDNGRGLPAGFNNDGLGLHMMRYRARMIGGSVELRRNSGPGATLECHFQKRLGAEPGA